MRKFITILFSLSSLFATSAFANDFSLTSSSLANKPTIPVTYTCDGSNISPALEWSDAPPKTASLALIVSDPDAPKGTFYHWVIFNIPTSITKLPENANPLPQGIKTGNNSADKAEYKGPCPPKGTTHHYIFTLYALDAPLDLPEGVDVKSVIGAMQTHIIGSAEFKSEFGH